MGIPHHAGSSRRPWTSARSRASTRAAATRAPRRSPPTCASSSATRRRSTRARRAGPRRRRAARRQVRSASKRHGDALYLSDDDDEEEEPARFRRAAVPRPLGLIRRPHAYSGFSSSDGASVSLRPASAERGRRGGPSAARRWSSTTHAPTGKGGGPSTRRHGPAKSLRFEL